MGDSGGAGPDPAPSRAPLMLGRPKFPRGTVDGYAAKGEIEVRSEVGRP